MKVDIDLNIPQSETHGILELETNTKKDKRKSTQMEDQETEAKARHKIFKREWILWVNNTKTN